MDISRSIQMIADEIYFDVLSSKFGYVRGFGHGEVTNTFTQCNYTKVMTTKKKANQLSNQVKYQSKQLNEQAQQLKVQD